MSEDTTGDSTPRVDRTYADAVTIRLRFVDSAADKADLSEEWTISTFGAAWEPDWLIQEVESIPLRAGRPGTSYPAEYYIESHERRMSWGADAVAFEILIGIASWAATSVAWDLTKSLALKMRDRLQAGSSEPSNESITDDRATTAALSAIQESYGEEMAALTIQSVQITSDSATVSAQSATGWHYEYDLELNGGLVEVTRVRRSRRSD